MFARMALCAFVWMLSACAQDAPAPEVRTNTITKIVYRDKSNEAAVPASVTDMQIKTMIAAGSVATYKGPCPCPESKEGTCRGRSAYERTGGQEPYCRPDDVPGELVSKVRGNLSLR